MRTNVLLLIACAASVAQQPVKCPGPLSETQLTDLIKSQVPESRLHVIVRTCGVGFTLTDPAKSRLGAAGASNDLLEEVRTHGPRKAPARAGDQNKLGHKSAPSARTPATTRTESGSNSNFELGHTLKVCDRFVEFIAFSPDSRWLV
jgi:hypothetical protein